MPRFLVKFPLPVVYQPDHPIARRIVTELVVSAPGPAQAIMHAVRQVQGDVGEPWVEQAPVKYQPPVAQEAPRDVTQIFEVGATFVKPAT